MGLKDTLARLREEGPLISVGVLTADLTRLGAELRLMEEAGVKLLHVDVMDGCFCPMMTVGPPFLKAMKTPLLKDVHLMVDDPLPKLVSFVEAGADVITVHMEATRHVHRVLQALGEMINANDPERGILRGVALNPGTPAEAVAPLLDEVDVVFALAVNPGWKGQRFIPATGDKLARLIEIVRGAGESVLLGVDGGVTRQNVGQVAAMGADVIVTGSAVFDGKAPAQNARFMLDAARGAGMT